MANKFGRVSIFKRVTDAQVFLIKKLSNVCLYQYGIYFVNF